jgi:Holliday junction resolvase-like predicted endonuclease
MKNEGLKAASVYLKLHGIKVIDTEYTCEAGCADVVFREGDELAFANVAISEGALPDEKLTIKDRSRMEAVACDYLMNRDIPSCRVRFDAVSVAMMGEGKVMLRHHRDVFSQLPERDIKRSGKENHAKGKDSKSQKTKRKAERER